MVEQQVDVRFVLEQVMSAVQELRDDVRELRRELRSVIDNQSNASTQGIRLLAEHDICRNMVIDHDKAIKELQKFKVQMITIASTVQVVVFALSWLIQKFWMAVPLPK